MGISLAGTEAWAVGDKLEAGTYLMKFSSVERTKSARDNEQVQVDLRVMAGPYKGAEQRDYITFVEAAMGRVVQLLQAIGEEIPQQDFPDMGAVADWVAGVLRKEPLVEVVIRLEPGVKDPTTEWPKVTGYRKPDKSDLDNDASGFTSAPSVGGGNGNGAAAEKLPF